MAEPFGTMEPVGGGGSAGGDWGGSTTKEEARPPHSAAMSPSSQRAIQGAKHTAKDAWEAYVRSAWGARLSSVLGEDWQQSCGHDVSSALLLWALQQSSVAQPHLQQSSDVPAMPHALPGPVTQLLAAVLPAVPSWERAEDSQPQQEKQQPPQEPAPQQKPPQEPALQQDPAPQQNQQQESEKSNQLQEDANPAAAATSVPGSSQLKAGSDSGNSSSPITGSPTKRKFRAARTRPAGAQRTSNDSSAGSSVLSSWSTPWSSRASSSAATSQQQQQQQQHPHLRSATTSGSGGGAATEDYFEGGGESLARLRLELQTQLLAPLGGLPPAILQLLSGRGSGSDGSSTNAAGAMAVLGALTSVMSAVAVPLRSMPTCSSDGGAASTISTDSGSAVSRRSGIGWLLDQGGHPAGVTPLHVAASIGRADVVERLMLVGCDSNKQAWLDSPLSAALSGPLTGPQKADVGASSGGGGGSSSSNHSVACPLLLPAGALSSSALLSGGEPLALGVTPLHVAAAAGHVDVVEVLLRGCPAADVNARTSEGYTALHLASQLGHAGVVDALVRSPGVDVNARDASGSAPLHHAAATAHGAVVDVLWPRGVDLDVCDAAGRTPLHLAAAAASGSEGLEVVGKLVIAGCDIAATDNEGLTAGHIAAFNGVCWGALFWEGEGGGSGVLFHLYPLFKLSQHPLTSHFMSTNPTNRPHFGVGKASDGWLGH